MVSAEPPTARPGGVAGRVAMDRHNERVRLFATALNNLGVVSLIAEIVAPSVGG